MIFAALVFLLASGAWADGRSAFIEEWLRGYKASAEQSADPKLVQRLSQAAIKQTKEHVVYDSRYYPMPYPGGDVPADRGVCTDVLIRAYRKLGVDLQEEVHMDMRSKFSAYPGIWGRKTPDTNIDHRRVPNLMVFFKRHGTTLPISKRPEDYKAGDIVAWDLGGGVTHIGLVVEAGPKPRIVHNIGYGPKLESVLFDWKVIGHFRYPAN